MGLKGRRSIELGEGTFNGKKRNMSRTMMRNNGNDSLGEDQRSVEVRPRVELEFLIK